MRLGLCCSLDGLDAAAAAGAGYVELAVTGVAVPEAPAHEWRASLSRMREGRLPAEAWNCLLPGDLKVVGPSVDSERLRRYLRVAAQRLGEAGAQVVVFGSGASRSVPDRFSPREALAQFGDACALAADAFAPHGVTVCVEPLHRGETNLLNSLEAGAALRAATAAPGWKLTADLFHMAAAGESLDALVRLVQLVGHAHVAGAERCPPSEGDPAVRDFIGALAAMGYDGRVSIECRWSDFASESGPALAALRHTTAS